MNRRIFNKIAKKEGYIKVLQKTIKFNTDVYDLVPVSVARMITNFDIRYLEKIKQEMKYDLINFIDEKNQLKYIEFPDRIIISMLLPIKRPDGSNVD